MSNACGSIRIEGDTPEEIAAKRIVASYVLLALYPPLRDVCWLGWMVCASWPIDSF